MKIKYILIFFCLSFITGCRSTGVEIFGKKSPHEKYAQKLKEAGLHETAMGKDWFFVSNNILHQPISVQLPFRETGFFPGEKVMANAYSFEARRGEVISVSLLKQPSNDFEIFIDLLQFSQDSIPENIMNADSTQFNFEVEKEGRYVLRLQPELLKSGTYTLTISSGPSLAFPVPGKERIQSFWGASRDGGNRTHEGVDIFANKGTPVIAVSDGRVNRVGLNNLGGKVIFIRPTKKNLSLYYAHLDSQLVQSGEFVKLGDTIGLIGNTGNAATTAPHLHFGIYSTGGAIDPLPFIEVNNKQPAATTLPINKLGKYARTINKTITADTYKGSVKILPYTLVYIQAAFGNTYKILLPDSVSTIIAGDQVQNLAILQKIKLNEEAIIYDRPNEKALQKGTVLIGEEVSVNAKFESYYFISHTNGLEGWLKQ